jgi:hypothetical protein
MGEAFRIGGWGMWPTLFFGLVMIAVALVYAVRADRNLSGLVRITVWMTLVAGCLGFLTGLIRSCLAISEVPADDRYIVVIGFGESLSNVVLALVLIMPALIITSVGIWRVARKPAG